MVNHYAQKKGEFLVTKEGQVLYAPGRSYLTLAVDILEKGKEGKIIRGLIFLWFSSLNIPHYFPI